MYGPNRHDERKVDSTKIKKDCGCRREDGVCSLFDRHKMYGKGGTTHGADRQADTDLRPQSG